MDKTDTYAFGTVLLELLTGEPHVDAQDALLSERMLEPLERPEQLLEPLLDTRLGSPGGGGGGDWPLSRAIVCIARRCIEMVALRRCTVVEVLPELDALAGRMAVRRAGRGEQYGGRTGQLVAKQR